MGKLTQCYQGVLQVPAVKFFQVFSRISAAHRFPVSTKWFNRLRLSFDEPITAQQDNLSKAMSLRPSGAVKNPETADWQGEDVGFCEACKPPVTKRHPQNKNSTVRLTGANVRRKRDNSKLRGWSQLSKSGHFTQNPRRVGS